MSVNLPSTLETIGDGCFRYCNNLRSIEILGAPEIGKCIFGRNWRQNQIKAYINPGATMYIHEAIDSPYVDIYTSASSFPDT